MKSMKHQIFYFPEAEARLESLCELKCDTSIDSSYYYGLLPFCKYIQRLIIINVDPKPNHGIAKLIEVQKNLKYFEWKDNFCDDILTEDPYEEVLLALEKKVASLMISVHFNKLDIISSIIENNGRRIKKILFRPYDIIDLEFDDFNFYENSLNFIRKVYENCPSIEYLSITFPSSRNHFTEFEKLLKICQNLKSLLIVLWNRDKVETYEKNGEELLKILIRSAPTNLKEIRLGDDFKFSLENLEDFLEKWRSRRAPSIFTIDPIYLREDYKNLIDKYKGEGVIKNFDYLCYLDLINYCINVL
ncbi:unnamed protein product [Rhizophagus irregularis]|nr:unnamed protein product [Rhizophagus irregularis]